MKIHLVTDSATDLPMSYAKDNDIEIVPLRVQFGEEVFIDGVDINNDQFYKQMSSSNFLPKTSLPSPQDFLDVFKKIGKEDSILCITISAATSGTYQSALVASSMVPNKVEVIDSLHISMGTGLQVMRAKELIDKGLSLEEIKQNILDFRHSIHTFIAIDDLENVVKGGRISNWKGSIAKAMKIKPILNLASDGSIKVVDYCRGRKRQMNRFIEHIQLTGKDLSQSKFVILHAKASSEEIIYLEEKVRELFNPKEIMIGELGPTMGSHGGFGAIGIAF